MVGVCSPADTDQPMQPEMSEPASCCWIARLRMWCLWVEVLYAQKMRHVCQWLETRLDFGSQPHKVYRGKILLCNRDSFLLSNGVTVLPYQSGTVSSGISVKNYDKCVFILQCPLLTCRLLMTLPAKSIISQLRQRVQTPSVFYR